MSAVAGLVPGCAAASLGPALVASPALADACFLEPFVAFFFGEYYAIKQKIKQSISTFVKSTRHDRNK